MRLFAITLLLVALTTPFSRADARDIILVADLWCPYNCYPDSEHPGYMIDIAKAAFTPAGHKVTYRLINWARAVREARRGHFQGIVGAFRGDAPDFVFPDEPLGLSGNAIFVSADNDWRYGGPESLKGMRIGAIRGYDYGDLTEALETYALVDVVGGDNALRTNIRKLVLGRIDAFVAEVSVARYQLERMHLQADVSLSPESVKYEEAYIAFPPGLEEASDYARLLSDTVRQMRRDGRLQAILARYGLQDWQTPSLSP